MCLFVWLLMRSLSYHFSLIWRSRWRAVNFDLCSTLMAIQQWGFLIAPHPLYLAYLMTRDTYCPAFVSGAITMCFFSTQVCRKRGSNPDIQHTRWTLYLYATAAVNNSKYFTTPNSMTFFKSKKMVLALYCLNAAPSVLI